LGEGYKADTRLDIIQRFFASKLAPTTTLVTTILRGKDYKGDDIQLSKELIQRVTPMVLQDLYDILKDNPSLIPAGLAAVFGVGVQTYEKRSKKL